MMPAEAILQYPQSRLAATCRVAPTISVPQPYQVTTRVCFVYWGGSDLARPRKLLDRYPRNALITEISPSSKLKPMATLAQQIVEVLQKQPGITDRALAEALFGSGTPQQRVNGECRRMVDLGLIRRNIRNDGRIGNYCTGKEIAPLPAAPSLSPVQGSVFSEDQLKTLLKTWLEAQGWTVEVAWAKAHGIDLHARKGHQLWIIEAKGSGSLNAMRVNYFLGVLGETLQRMNDPDAAYSIALPDVKQFRNLWTRLPVLAKQRTKISALFVRNDGRIDLVE